MVKALHFKGDKKVSKKRKRAQAGAEEDLEADSTSKALTTTTNAPTTTPNDAEEDDSWVSAESATDISGPVILILPTETPSALSCDAAGSVFPIAVENLVDGDPSTSEPHDVRQVWVANRIAGTESFSFKGHQKKYLSCDKFGILSAGKEAVGPEEQFLCIPVSDNPGGFAIQNAREKFLEIDEDKTGSGKVRGDAETIQFTSTLRIRMQARFKPRLKVAKEERAHAKITRKELEDIVGRKLEDSDVKLLKRARREGDFGEKLLDVKVKGKHDKFA